MSAHLNAKLALRCTYPGCQSDPLDDHNNCERHRDDHRSRNRLSMRRARLFKKLQLPLVGVG